MGLEGDWRVSGNEAGKAAVEGAVASDSDAPLSAYSAGTAITPVMSRNQQSTLILTSALRLIIGQVFR